MTYEIAEIGPLTLVTAPSGLVVPLTEAKLNLRVDSDLTVEDGLIRSKILAAQKFCENEFGARRQFLSATYEVSLRSWWGCPIQLPSPPLRSVTSIKYYDADDVLTTLATSYYEVKTPIRQRGTVELAADQTWPAFNSSRRLPITIRFVAGYGTAADVPETIKEAIHLVVGWLYQNREPTALEMSAVESLLMSEGYGVYG